MICIARIKEASDDRPRRVRHGGEGTLAYGCARARGVKRGEAAPLIPHEAVIHIARVNVISRNRPRWREPGRWTGLKYSSAFLFLFLLGLKGE